MVEFKSIQMFLILMLSVTAAVTQHYSSITVRVGDEATLPCIDVKNLHERCRGTIWIFSDSTNRQSATLFEDGQVHRDTAAKSDKLSVTEKCSLVIKKVTDEDAGLYICRQFDKSGKQVTSDSPVDLIVTNTVTQHTSSITVRVGDEATLLCEDVKDLHDNCHSTTWIFGDSTNRPVVTVFEDGQIHREAAAKSDRLSVTEKCSLVIKKVTVKDAGLYICRQFISGQKVTESWVDLSVDNRNDTPTTTDTVAAEKSPNAGGWSRLICVLVGVAALSMVVVSVNIWTRTKGYKTHRGKKQHNNEDDVVTYENAEDVSAPVRFHRSTNIS